MLLEGGMGLAAAMGGGKVAVIHRGTGEQDRARHCHQLTGLPGGMHGAGSQGEGLRVLEPTAEASAGCLLPLDMNPPWAFGKGNTEFSKPGPTPAFKQPAAYLFIHLLLLVPPAW